MANKHRKDAQHRSLLEKCKSKLQWDITLHWSERPSSKSLQTINAGEGVEKRDRSYTVGGNVNWYIKYNLNYIQWKLIQPLWKMVWRFLKKLGIKPPWREVKSLSCVRLFATPWTVAYQAPRSMEFSRQEYWSGLPLPSPKTTIWPSNPTPRHILWGNQNWKRHIYPIVHCSTIYSS